MAVVGDAYVYIRAITDGIEDDIRRGLAKSNRIIDQAGRDAGETYSKAFNKGGGGRGTFFSAKFEAEASNARETLFRLVTVGNLLTPAITGTVGAVGALVTSLFSLGSAAGVAAPSLIALPAAFSAIAQGAITARLAFGGIGQAISAGMRGGGGGGGGARQLQDFADQIEDAADRIAAARRRLTEALRDNVQRRLDALDAAKNSEEVVQETIFAASRAQRDYADSQNDTRKALDNLSKARQQAIEDLQQLRFESEGAVLSEQRARLAFERSRDSLQRVQDLPPNSRARQEAELAFKEADLNLRRAIDRNGDLQKEEKRATKAGIEGSDAVIDAQENLSNARRAEADALRDVIEANKDIVRARMDAAKAARAVGQVERDNLQRQKDALKDLTDALKNYEEVREEQFKNEQGRSGGGSDPFAESMKNLSKEAQDFVRYIISIQGEFRKLRAAAGRELFPQLEVAIQNLVDNLFPRLIPLLESTGGVLGKVAREFSNTITTGENLARLDRVWKTNNKLLQNFGDAASNLYELFLILLDAAAPLIERFGNWVVTLTEAWLATARISDASGRLTKVFIRSGDAAAQIGRIFKNTFGGLSAMFKASVGPGSGGQFLLDWFETATAQFAKLREEGNKDGSLVFFFKQSAITAAATLGLIGDILKVVVKLGADPNTTLFVETLRGVVPILETILFSFNTAGPALAELSVEVSKILLAFTDTQAIQTYFDVLITLAKLVVDIFSNDIMQAILGVVGPIFAAAAAFRFFTKLVIFFGKALAGIAISSFTLAVKALGFTFSAAGLKAAAGATGVKKFILTLKALSFSNPFLLALTAITTALTIFYVRGQQADERASEFMDTLDELTGKATAASRELIALKLLEALPQKSELRLVVDSIGLTMTQITTAVTEGGQAFEDLSAKIEAAIEAEQTALGLVYEERAKLTDLKSEEALQNAAEIDRLSYTIYGLKETQKALKLNSDAYGDATEAKRKELDALALLNEANDALLPSQEELREAFRQNIRTLTEQEGAFMRTEEAQERLTGETKALEQAFEDLNAAMSQERSAIALRKMYRELDEQVKTNGTNLLGLGKKADANKILVMDAVEEVTARVKGLGLSPADSAIEFEKGLTTLREKFVGAGFKEKDLDEFLSGIEATPEDAQELFREVKEAGEEAVDEYKQLGIDSGDGFIEGLRTRYAQSVAAGKYLANGVKTGADSVMEFGSPSREMAKLGRWVSEGFATGIEERGDLVVDSFTDILDKMADKGGENVKKFTDKVKGLLEVFVGDLKMVGEATKDFNDSLTEALNPPELDARDLTDPLLFVEKALATAEEKAKKFNNSLTGGVGGDRKRSRLIADFTTLSETLKTDLILGLEAAESKLASLQDVAANFSKTVNSAITGGVDIQSAAQKAKDEGKTLEQVLSEQLNKTRTFASKVNELIDAGYSKTTIESVLARGVEGGTELAQAILDAGTSVLKIDQSVGTELENLAASLSDKGYNAFFATGIESAEGTLESVREKLQAAQLPGSTVMTTMDRFAKALGRDVTIKVKLNRRRFDVTIDVKRILRATDFQGSDGIEGVGATGGIVNRPTIALIGEAGPEAVVPLNKTPGNGPLPSGFGGVTVNVYPSAGMNEEELANMVSRKLAFEMRRGAV